MVSLEDTQIDTKSGTNNRRLGLEALGTPRLPLIVESSVSWATICWPSWRPNCRRRLWLPGLTDGQILERLVALNAARAAEETGGLVRWLRPEYQAPAAAPQVAQPALLVAGPAAVAPGQKQPWPAAMAEQAQAVRAVLHSFEQPVSPAQIAAAFERAPKARVAELLETLASLGQARRLPSGV